MRANRFAVGATLVAAALLIGCGHSGIVGKWQANVPVGRMSIPMTMEFGPDGKVSQTYTVPSPRGARSLAVSGTYSVEGDTVKVTQTGVTVDGRPAPAQWVQMFGRTLSQSSSFKIDGDTLTMTQPGNPEALTMTRVKQ